MPVINGKYYTEREIEEIKRELNDNAAFEKFLVSGVVGAVTGSALLGGIVGGSFLGGIVGDMFGGDDDAF